MSKELTNHLSQRPVVRAPRRKAMAHRRRNHPFIPEVERLEGRTLLSITLSSTATFLTLPLSGDPPACIHSGQSPPCGPHLPAPRTGVPTEAAPHL